MLLLRILVTLKRQKPGGKKKAHRRGCTNDPQWWGVSGKYVIHATTETAATTAKIPIKIFMEKVSPLLIGVLSCPVSRTAKQNFFSRIGKKKKAHD